MILFCNLCHKINSTVLGLKSSMYCRKIFLFFLFLFFLKAERQNYTYMETGPSAKLLQAKW